MKLITNEDMEIQAIPKGAWTPANPNDISEVTILTEKAGNGKANNKKILINKIEWNIIPTSCSFANHTHVSGSNSTPINGTSKNIKCDGKKIILDGDTGECQGLFTNDNTGASVICKCDFKVINAGQTNAKGK